MTTQQQTLEMRLETADDIINSENLVDQWLDKYQQMANSYGRYINNDPIYVTYLQQTTDYIRMLSQWKREFTAFREKRITVSQLQTALAPKQQGSAAIESSGQQQQNNHQSMSRTSGGPTASAAYGSNISYSHANTPTTHATSSYGMISQHQPPSTSSGQPTRFANKPPPPPPPDEPGSATMPIILSDSPQRPTPARNQYNQQPPLPPPTQSNYADNSGFTSFSAASKNASPLSQQPLPQQQQQRPLSPVQLAPMSRFSLFSSAQQHEQPPKSMPQQQQRWLADRHGNKFYPGQNAQPPVDELASVRSRLGRQDLMLGALPSTEDLNRNENNAAPLYLNQLAAADPGLTMLVRGVNDTAEAYVEGKRQRDPKIQMLSQRILKYAEPDPDFGPRVWFDRECEEVDFARSRWTARPAEPYVNISALEDALERTEKQQKRDAELQRALADELETMRRREADGMQEPINVAAPPPPPAAVPLDVGVDRQQFDGVQNMLAILGHGDEPFGSRMNQLFASFQKMPSFPGAVEQQEPHHAANAAESTSGSAVKQFSAPPKANLPSSRPRRDAGRSVAGSSRSDGEKMKPNRSEKRSENSSTLEHANSSDKLNMPTLDDLSSGNLMLTMPPPSTISLANTVAPIAGKLDAFKREILRAKEGTKFANNASCGGFNHETERQRIYGEFRSTLRKEFPGIGNARIEEAVLEAMSRLTADQLEEAEKAAFEAECLRRSSEKLSTEAGTKASDSRVGEQKRRGSRTSADRAVGVRGGRPARSRSRELRLGGGGRSPSRSKRRSTSRGAASNSTASRTKRRSRSPSSSSKSKSSALDSAHSSSERRRSSLHDKEGSSDVKKAAVSSRRSPKRSVELKTDNSSKKLRKQRSPSLVNGRRRSPAQGSIRDRAAPAVQKAAETLPAPTLTPTMPLEAFVGPFVDDPSVIHRVLILRGPPGCGKSTIAHDIRETFLLCVPGANTPEADCHIISPDEIAIAIRLLEHEQELIAGNVLPPPTVDDIDAELRRASTPDRYNKLRHEVRYQSDLTSVFAARLNNNADVVRKRLVIIDAVNDKVEMFMPLLQIAQERQVQCFVGELSRDRFILTEKDFHAKRSARDIRMILNNWEATPPFLPKVDVTTRLNQIVVAAEPINKADIGRNKPPKRRENDAGRPRELSPPQARFSVNNEPQIVGEFAISPFAQQQSYANLSFMVRSDEHGVPQLHPHNAPVVENTPFHTGPRPVSDEFVNSRWKTPPLHRPENLQMQQQEYLSTTMPLNGGVNSDLIGAIARNSNRWNDPLPGDYREAISSGGSDSALFSRNALISRNFNQQRPLRAGVDGGAEELGVRVIVDNNDADGPSDSRPARPPQQLRQSANYSSKSSMAPPRQPTLTAKQAGRYYNMGHPTNSNRTYSNDDRSRGGKQQFGNQNKAKNSTTQREELHAGKILGGKPLNLTWNKKATNGLTGQKK